MRNGISTWDEIRRIADELELKIHLAGMSARDKWKELKPQLAELERSLEDAGKRAGTAIDEQLDSVAAALRKLRDDIADIAKN